MPGDSVVPAGKLKKQLLFFDKIMLSDPCDRALVADHELRDVYPNGTAIDHAGRAPFPIEQDYQIQFEELIRGTETLQHRGVLRVLGPQDWRAVDPWLRLRLYYSAISDKQLVRAAICDACQGRRINIPDGIIYGIDILMSGWKREPPLRSDEPYIIPNIDDGLNHLAYLRIGRAIKYLRVAQLKNASPVGWDEPTSEILVSLGAGGFSETIAPESIAGMAIELDVVEPQQLEDALSDMPWVDVIKIRKEVLPLVANYRYQIVQIARRLYRRQVTDLDGYLKIVQQDREALDTAKKELKKAWQGLKIVGLLRGAATAASTGAASFLIPTDWISLFGTILTGVGVGAGLLSNEIKAVLQTRQQVTENPIFVIDRLLKRIK